MELTWKRVETRKSIERVGRKGEQKGKMKARTKQRRKGEKENQEEDGVSMSVPLISNETEVHSLISSPLFPPLLWLIRSFLHACFLSVSPSFHSVFLSNVRPREKGG
jgi:hypothetical protein